MATFPGVPFDGPPLPPNGNTITVAGKCTYQVPVEVCSSLPPNNCGGSVTITEGSSLSYGSSNISPNGNVTINSSAYCAGYFAFMTVTATCADGSTRVLDSFVSSGLDENGDCPASEYSRSFFGVCCPKPEEKCVTTTQTITTNVTAAATIFTLEGRMEALDQGNLDKISQRLRDALGKTGLPRETFEDLARQLNQQNYGDMFKLGPNGIAPVDTVGDWLKNMQPPKNIADLSPDDLKSFTRSFEIRRATFLNDLFKTVSNLGENGYELVKGKGDLWRFLPKSPPPGGLLRGVLKAGGGLIRGIIGVGGVGMGLIEVIIDPKLMFPQIPGVNNPDCAFNFNPPNGGGGEGDLLGDNGDSTPVAIAALASNSPVVPSIVSNNLLIRANQGSPYSTFPSAITPKREYTI